MYGESSFLNLPKAVIQKLISSVRNCLRNGHLGGLQGGIRNSKSMRVQYCINCGQFLAKFRKFIQITKFMQKKTTPTVIKIETN